MRLSNLPDYAYMNGLKLSFIDSEGVLGYIDAPKKPYGFVDTTSALFKTGEVEVEETDLKAADTGRKVYRFEMEIPARVGDLGRELERNGLKSYETDIPYVRRLIIDGDVEIRYNGVVFLDIELDDSKGWQRPGAMPLKSYAYSFGGEVEYMPADGDISMIAELIEEMVKRQVFVIAGWNVQFDYNHLIALVRRKDYKHVLKHCELIDLRSIYSFYKRGLGSYSLENVAAYEGLGEKRRVGKIANLSSFELERYNVNDVELLLKLEERYSFVKKVMRMAEELRIPVSDILAGETVVWDYLILRRLRELGYVAPRKKKHEKSSYEGALVLEPRPGLHRDVASFDFVSLYPSIILRDRIDVFGFKGEVVPYFMAQFFAKKNEADARGDMIAREMYKTLMNSCYGMFGYSGSRYYDRGKAEHVTREGRKALESLVRFMSEMGVKVYFGDTDSVFVDATAFGNLGALEGLINRKFYPLQIKLDKRFKSILFLGREGRGVKKRYIGLTVDGKLVERGIETRRGDWCEYTKKVLKEVALLILDGRESEVSKKIAEFRNKLLKGQVDLGELEIARHLKDDLDYKTEPAWYKLWKRLVKEGKIPAESREISYWLGRDGELLESPYRDGKIVVNFMEYWTKQIEPPLKRLLESVSEGKTTRLTEVMEYGSPHREG